jgi:hypothetical protein
MTRRLPFLVPLGLVALAIVIGVLFRYPLVTDDPYITYRYALNLVNGAGFVFNPGERVLSTTTPLYAFVLAFLGLVYREIPALGYWLSVVSYGVAAGLLYTAARAVNLRGGGISAGVLILLSPALIATFGLETGFYLMLGIAALRAYADRRVSLAFAFAALLTLTRNDGVVLVLILSLHYLYTRLTPPRDAAGLGEGASRTADRIRTALFDVSFLRPFLIYLAIMLPYLVFCALYFGSPFPFTLAAKVAQAQSGLWDPFATGFVKWLAANGWWLAAQFGFALVGTVWALRARAIMLLAGAWGVAHFVAYSLLGVAFYPWYVASLFPALCLFAGVGMELCARWAAARLGARNVARVVLLVVLTGGAAVLELRAAVDAGMLRPSPKVEAYERAARWVAENTDPSAEVDALEVGVIGYFDQRRTYDFVGLVDPMRIPYLRAQKFADGVRRRAAAYVIAIPPDTWLPGDVWFKDAYRAVHEIRVPGFYSNRALVIYERAGARSAPAETLTVNAAFEKRIGLEEIDLYARTVSPAQVLPVRLNLRALDRAPVPEDWKFTLQLVGAEDRVIAQTDNYYPARLPEDGLSFYDYQGIPIPTGAPAGTYALILAMYRAADGERLSIYDAAGVEAGDFLSLGQITIQ